MGDSRNVSTESTHSIINVTFVLTKILSTQLNIQHTILCTHILEGIGAHMSPAAYKVEPYTSDVRLSC